MTRLRLTYRRADDDEGSVRHALTPVGYVFVFGHGSTPVTVAVSELRAVELVDDEAQPPPESLLGNPSRTRLRIRRRHRAGGHGSIGCRGSRRRSLPSA